MTLISIFELRWETMNHFHTLILLVFCFLEEKEYKSFWSQQHCIHLENQSCFLKFPVRMKLSKLNNNDNECSARVSYQLNGVKFFIYKGKFRSVTLTKKLWNTTISLKILPRFYPMSHIWLLHIPLNYLTDSEQINVQFHLNNCCLSTRVFYCWLTVIFPLFPHFYALLLQEDNIIL